MTYFFNDLSNFLNIRKISSLDFKVNTKNEFVFQKNK